MQLYQIILLCLTAIVAGLYIYKRVTGVDLLKMLVLSKPMVVAITSVVDALCKLMPNDA